MRNAFFLISCIFLSFSSLAQTQVSSSKLESILLYSALKYMEWPSNDFSEFKVLVVGNDELFNELQMLSRAKKVGNRSIAVKQIPTIAEIEESHILVLGSAQVRQLEKAVEQIGAFATIIVTNKDGYLTKGADLNFVIRDGKLVFQVNEPMLTKKGIKVAASLLMMAENRNGK